MAVLRQVTVSEATEEYVQRLRQRAAAVTAGNAESILGLLCRHRDGRTVLGDMQMRHLRAEHLERYFYGQSRGRGAGCGVRQRVSPGTFNAYRTRILIWLRWCERRRYVLSAEDLMADVAREVYHVPPKTRLSATELARVLELSGRRHPRDRMLVAMAMHTGFRVSEIVRLTVGDVDLDAGFMNVFMTKTHKWDRFPINSDLDGELRSWLTWYAEHLRVHPVDRWETVEGGTGRSSSRVAEKGVNVLRDDMLLIPNRQAGGMLEGGRWMAPLDWPLRPWDVVTGPQRIYARIKADAGIDTPGEALHMFRRSIARLYYEDCLRDGAARDDALLQTMTFLNHSSVAMTMRYIGADRQREDRDMRLRGKPFLSRLVAEETGGKVVGIHAAGPGGG